MDSERWEEGERTISEVDWVRRSGASPDRRSGASGIPDAKLAGAAKLAAAAREREPETTHQWRTELHHHNIRVESNLGVSSGVAGAHERCS